MEPNAIDNQKFESFVQLRETPEEIAFELRAQEGALWTGGRLLIGIWAFAFAALAFAYFYLRSSNDERPVAPQGDHGAHGDRCCHLRHYRGRRTPRPVRRAAIPRERDPRLAGCRLDLGPRRLLVIGLQIWQLTALPFFPGSSGYASCFIGWAAMNIALVLCGTYWLETILAREIRLRRAIAQDGGAPSSTLPVARLFRANLNGCTYFWGFIALVATFFWVLFYVI